MSDLFDGSGNKISGEKSNLPSSRKEIEGILKKIPIQTPEGFDTTYLMFKQNRLAPADSPEAWEVVMSFDTAILGDIDLQGRVKLTVIVERKPLEPGDVKLLMSGPPAPGVSGPVPGSGN